MSKEKKSKEAEKGDGTLSDDALESVRGGVIDGGCIPDPLEPAFPLPTLDPVGPLVDEPAPDPVPLPPEIFRVQWRP